MDDIGSKLRQARKEAGLSLAALGRRAGVSAATLSRYENGRGEPSVDVLREAAAALGVSLERWMGSVSALDPQQGLEAGAAVHDVGWWRNYDDLRLDPVLGGALQCFARLGYHGTSMRDLASAAGMSVAGIYHHYAGKQAVLVALMDLTMTDFWSRCEAARSEGATAHERFELLVECFSLFHMERQVLAFIGGSEMRSLEEPDRRRIAQVRSDCEHMIAAELSALARQGRLGTTRHREAARAIATMLVGIASWYQEAGPQTPTQVAEQYVGFANGIVGFT